MSEEQGTTPPAISESDILVELPDAIPSDEAIEALARLLVDYCSNESQPQETEHGIVTHH